MTKVFTVLLMALSFSAFGQTGGDTGQKAVLITGASSGIGRNMAETLAREGYYVYAGARKQEDIDALTAIDNIEGIRLDVNVQEEIDAYELMVKVDSRRVQRLFVGD